MLPEGSLFAAIEIRRQNKQITASMGKSHVPALFRAFVLVLLAILGQLSPLQAQTDYTIGSGTTGNSGTQFPAPLPANFEGTRSQFLIRASELTAAGMTRGYLAGIKFNVTALNGVSYVPAYTIRLSNTTVNELKADSWEPQGAVHYTSGEFVPELGVNNFVFPDNFLWDGTSNLLIEICTNGGNRFFDMQSFNPTVAWTTDLGFTASHSHGRNDQPGFCSVATTAEIGTGTTRPNFTFTWKTAPPECDGKPDAGSAKAASATLCKPGERILLSLDGTTAATGMTYQWQSSPDGTTWADLDGAIKDTFTVSVLDNTQYRAIVTCSKSAVSDTSDLVTISRSAGVSGTFTINNSLTNPGPGEFKSFNDAYNHIQCGINGPVIFDVVNTGTPYTEQLTMDPVFGTSATNTIRFNGNGATIQFSASEESNAAVIRLRGADYVTFDNLTITALAQNDWEYGVGVLLDSDADYNNILNCRINLNLHTTSYNFTGILIGASAGYPVGSGRTLSDNNRFEGNTVTGGSYSIVIAGSYDMANQNNQIINNKVLDFYYTGIYVTYTNNTLIEGNDVTRPTRTESYQWEALRGIQTNQLNINMRILRNRIHALKDGELLSTNPTTGIHIGNTDAEIGSENIIANNLIYDIKGQGNITGITNFGSSAAYFYHNTISLDWAESKATGTTIGMFYTSAVSAAQFVNNIVSIHRGGDGKKYCIALEETPEFFTSDYNDFFIPSSGFFYTGQIGTEEYQTLADWKAAAKQDEHSLATDPGFQAASTFDFKPTSAILNDKGTGVDVAADFDNAERSKTQPDMGAYEFALPACQTNSNPGEAFTSVGNSTCPDKPIMLNLRGYDVGSGLTYQWQSAPAASGPWTNISDPLLYPAFSTVSQTGTVYYRAALSCNGGNAVYSQVTSIVSGLPFPAGTYTIDKTAATDPEGTKNFNSFSDAIAAISCGIAGPVVFNVKDGVYEEQLRIAAISGTSAVNTVVFQSESGDASKVELGFESSDPLKNYVLRLDSAAYIQFKKISFKTSSPTIGRIVELANIASNDLFEGCVFNGATVFDANTLSAGIFAETNFSGKNIRIAGNTFNKSAYGIYIKGYTANKPADSLQIENNTFREVYYIGAYTSYTNNLVVKNNDFEIKTDYESYGWKQGVAGIDASFGKGKTIVSGNKIITAYTKETGGNVYGINLNEIRAEQNDKADISGNRIIARNFMTGSLVGLNVNMSANLRVVNNVVSVLGSGTSEWQVNSAALYSANARFTDYQNNTLVNSSTGVMHYAAYFDHQYYMDAGGATFTNNVVANTGGGPAEYHNYNVDYVKSDYNLLYTTGENLIYMGPQYTTFEKYFKTLAEWQNMYYNDLNSISYKPAFLSEENPAPDAANADAWAMQGRGIQIPGNDKDINGNPRAVTLEAGVPDLGAYEFQPTVAPPVLTGIPASPAAGTTQAFLMGTDTVAKISWPAGEAVPQNITLQRYTGVLPEGLNAAEQSMYFYTKATVSGTGDYKYDYQLFYLDPWMRNIPVESTVKLGKTDNSSAWVASGKGLLDSISNFVTDSSLQYIDRFTGMSDGKIPAQPEITTSADSSNKGTRFWVPYGAMQDFKSANNQRLRLVLAADAPATVAVSVNGTSFKKVYTIGAGEIVYSDEIPKTGVSDARLLDEGLYHRGILVESTSPISVHAVLDNGVYAHNMVLPTGTYGYTYTALGYRQSSGYSESGTSWMNIIADHDNTVVEITPSVPTKGGREAGKPFRVTLNRGDVYQVMGAFKERHNPNTYDEGYEYYEISGTTVVSVSNSEGKCHPIAVFSGSGGTGIYCDETIFNGGGNSPLMQQNFPDQGWGRHFLTSPNYTRIGLEQPVFQIYRVLVKDPATVVKRNGVELTGKTGSWYEFVSNTSDHIEASQPVMVAMFNPYFSSCGNDFYTPGGGNMGYVQEGMTYLTALGNGVKSAQFMRTKSMDPYDAVSFKNYLVIIVPTTGLSSLKVDGSSDFTKVFDHPQMAGYSVAVKQWDAANVVGKIECDTTFSATASFVGNGAHFYNVGMKLPRVEIGDKGVHNVFNTSGNANTYTCVNTPFRPSVTLPVIPNMLQWHTGAVSGLTPGSDITQLNPVPADTIEVDFREYYVFTLDQDLTMKNTGDFVIPVSGTYRAGNNPDGCDNAVEGKVNLKVVNAPLIGYNVQFAGCETDTAFFSGTVTDLQPGVIIDRWNWSFGDGNTANKQDTSHHYSEPGMYDVLLQGIGTDGCVDSSKTTITVFVVADAPQPRVKEVSFNSVTFEWPAAANARGYEVSTDGGSTWNIPSSGATGLTHTVGGMQPGQSVTIIVRSTGTCKDLASGSVTGTTYEDNIVIPNAITPNGDGKNDVIRINGSGIRDMDMMIFNQWGQKIAQSSNPAAAWDGKWNGKVQPSGVYMYVCEITLMDGRKIVKKGSINLIL